MRPSDISLSSLQKETFIEHMKDVYTSIPGHIVTFNGNLQRAQIQIGIQRVLIDDTIEIPSVLAGVPVIFPGGSDYTLEFQVGLGTEGAIFFSQRCIDGWKNSGGVAENPLTRFFDAQDCYFMPGLRSQPGAISEFQNNGIRLRNKSGNQFAWLKNDGSIAVENGIGHIRVSESGVVTINGVTIQPNGDVDTPAALRNKSIDVSSTHKHGGVTPGGGTTGTPQ